MNNHLRMHLYRLTSVSSSIRHVTSGWNQCTSSVSSRRYRITTAAIHGRTTSGFLSAKHLNRRYLSTNHPQLVSVRPAKKTPLLCHRLAMRIRTPRHPFLNAFWLLEGYAKTLRAHARRLGILCFP